MYIDVFEVVVYAVKLSSYYFISCFLSLYVFMCCLLPL